MIGELLEVRLLLVELLPELHELFLLALADGVVLGALLTALEGIAVEDQFVSPIHRGQGRPYRSGGGADQLEPERDGGSGCGTYPGPP